MRHVEFLGPPGSGKSTLAAGLATGSGVIGLEEAVRLVVRDHGSNRLTRVAARLSRSARSRLWRTAYGRSSDRTSAMARFDAKHPDLMKAVVEAQSARAGRDRGQDLVRGWVTNLTARYQLAAEAAAGDVVVIDEGFTQRAVAIFGYGFAAEDHPLLARYLSSMPPADAVIVVDTPLEVCASRLDARGWSERVADLPTEERLRFLDSSAQVVAHVNDWLVEAGRQVVTVDGTAPEAVGSTVTDVLAQSPEPSDNEHD